MKGKNVNAETKAAQRTDHDQKSYTTEKTYNESPTEYRDAKTPSQWTTNDDERRVSKDEYNGSTESCNLSKEAK